MIFMTANPDSERLIQSLQLTVPGSYARWEVATPPINHMSALAV